MGPELLTSSHHLSLLHLLQSQPSLTTPIPFTLLLPAVRWATDAMGPELLKEVAEFFRKAKAKEIDASSLCDEGT